MSDIDRVVVLAGGLSPEREVSLRSGHRVRDALAEAGIDAVVADADAELLSVLRADPPSAVFPAIHGACGEDGAIREVLALTGSDLTEEHWDAFFGFYMDTGARKWGRPYLNRLFFSLLGERMAGRAREDHFLLAPRQRS